MKWNHDKRVGVAAVLAALLILTGVNGIFAGEQAEDPAARPSEMGKAPMMDDAMMQMRQQMHARMRAMDERLDALVAAMNAAGDNDKADAVAAVVTELVNQRKAMHSMMMEMQPRMMRHMMEHVSTGMMKGAQRSMADCPMMGQMLSATEPDQEGEEPPEQQPGE